MEIKKIRQEPWDGVYKVIDNTNKKEIKE